MAFDEYHKQYAAKADEEIAKRLAVKKDEIAAALDAVPLDIPDDTVKVAVLGCAERRLVEGHKAIFSEVLGKNVDITTFDIEIRHLEGAENVVQHDCTEPLPGGPYHITYGHVLLKFMPIDKQIRVLMESYFGLTPGGVALHIMNSEEIDSSSPKLSDGYRAVPLKIIKQILEAEEVPYEIVPIQYGSILVLKRS